MKHLLNRNDAIGLGSAPASGAAGRALAARPEHSIDSTVPCGRTRSGSARGRAEPQPGRLCSPLVLIAAFRLNLSASFALLWLLCGCASTRHVGETHNRALIQRYFADWANHGNVAAADELIAPDVTLINPPTTLRSLAEYKASMAAFHRGFPDLHFTIEDMVASGDRVVVRWKLRCTQLGEFAGRPSSGRPVAITGTSSFRIADGKIREIWVNLDRLSMMQQLGWTLTPP